MNRILDAYLMATTSRYLLPPTLKTTRELLIWLAFLCCRLMFAGMAQPTFDASANQVDTRMLLNEARSEPNLTNAIQKWVRELEVVRDDFPGELKKLRP